MLKEIKERWSAITPQGWKEWPLAPDSDPEKRSIITSADGEREICGIVYNPLDAAAIAHAPTDVKHLIYLVEELQFKLETVRQAIAG